MIVKWILQYFEEQMPEVIQGVFRETFFSKGNGT